MSFRKVLYTFTEGWRSKKVVWFEGDYEAVKNGSGAHSGGHPEIATHFNIVKKAIENPDEVKQDKAKGDRKCYYAWFSGDRRYPNMHMKVVLKQSKLSGKMYVVTAYFTSGINSGETSLWTKT